MADIHDEDDSRSRVEAKLKQGERILWIGRPDPRVNFTAADGFEIPFSIVWTAFATYVVVDLMQYGSYLIGLALLPAFGLYLIFGRFIYKRWNKRRTTYAITSQRALVLVGPSRLNSVEARGQQITSDPSRDGRHMTVLFEPGTRWFTSRSFAPNMGLDWWPKFARWPLAFYDVADVTGLKDALAQSRVPAEEGVHHG